MKPKVVEERIFVSRRLLVAAVVCFILSFVSVGFHLSIFVRIGFLIASFVFLLAALRVSQLYFR